MKLPEHIAVTEAALSGIARRHRLPIDGPFGRLPETGIFNAHYLIGSEHVVRVPRNHPEHFAALRREAIAVPAVRQAGVRAPELIAIDESCEVLPCPFAIYRRVAGETLESLDAPPDVASAIWRQLGHELGRTHAVPLQADRALPPPAALADPRELVHAHASAGWFSTSEARWIEQWLSRLAPFALAPVRTRLVHGDTQGSNIMVSPDARSLIALMDWGSAAWGTQVDDFAAMPLRVVPFVLEGYRDIALVEEDPNLEALIVWRHVQLGLITVPRGPLPGFSWAERPLSMLLETLAFFATAPPDPWRELGPSP